MPLPSDEIIAAIATPPGRGGVAMVRVSGANLEVLIRGLLGKTPEARRAVYTGFLNAEGAAMDRGIAIYYPGPHSYTGENTLELHCHGNPLLADKLLRRAMQLGARIANPGEFTQRAYLNGKMDLAESEAVADLINATTELALRSALNSLEGDFSRRIDALALKLTELRVQAEAALDFSDEDIDPLENEALKEGVANSLAALKSLLAQTRQGVILRDGYTVVLAGQPNSGKSSLLNRLSGRDSAIVADIPGTTRDILREPIEIDGMPLHIIDTAGLRHSEDPIEQEGVRRAQAQMAKADRILHVIDANNPLSRHLEIELPEGIPVTRIHNKVDLTTNPPGMVSNDADTDIFLSAKTGAGLEALREHIKQSAGFRAEGEGLFIARSRHLDALARCESHLTEALLLCKSGLQELLAEQLRRAHDALGEITGAVSADELLGHIFCNFCVGK